MNWKVRHEGSPGAPVEMSLEQLREGLVDGRWEPTDEVMGPGESEWQAIENHPALEELAMDLEPPPPRTYDDEARLDMNALIDVCLVLLVFFILTTTVAAMQKRLEAPSVDPSKPGVAVVTKEQVAESMIHVKAQLEGGKPVVRVEDKVVEMHLLQRELRNYVQKTSKTVLLLEHDDNVPQDLVVQIIDASKGANMDSVRLVVP